jgi:hypothetical protein
MLYDHRDEHKQNVVFAVKSRAGTLFVSLLICSIAVDLPPKTVQIES